MDTRKISLHLSGKTSPYKSYSRLEFFEHLEEVFGYSFEKLDFYWKQAREFEEEFYFLVFEKLYSKSLKNKNEKEKLDKLLHFLDLPSGITGISSEFNYDKLLEEFNNIKKTKTSKSDGSSQEKGKAFEIFLENLFNSIDGLDVTSIKQAEDEQIDLVIKNKINQPFWTNLNSSIITGEAKNWSKKTNTEVINTLRGKMVGHVNFSRIGMVISMNGFTKAVEPNLLRDGAGNLIIVVITGEDIIKLLEEKLNPIEWLEELFMKSFA